PDPRPAHPGAVQAPRIAPRPRKTPPHPSVRTPDPGRMPAPEEMAFRAPRVRFPRAEAPLPHTPPQIAALERCSRALSPVARDQMRPAAQATSLPAPSNGTQEQL